MSYHMIATLTDATGSHLPAKPAPGRPRDGIEIQAYSMGVESPRDSASGQVTGRRTHKPVTMVGEFTLAKPRLYGILNTKATLPTVEIHFYPSADLQAAPAYLVELNDVSIVSINPHSRATPVTGRQVVHSPLLSRDVEELTRIEFTFRTITVTHGSGKKTSEDDWLSTG
ncbi:MAG TPA: type VI secretion system tube protein Hcp [Planctomycetota bacterium]|nr:type VI secretion system tube protein Hcp [Planctomycetota bacterium]